jgi:hypothetical protein
LVKRGKGRFYDDFLLTNIPPVVPFPKGGIITKRRVPMKSRRGVSLIVWFFISIAIVFSCLISNGDAGPRGGRTVEGPRGGETVEGPRGNVAVEGPRGNVAVGTRYNILPGSARALIVGERTYYVDDSGVYYLPCDDDDTVYCVVPAP